MSIIIALYITLIGLIMGSFYNVVASRIPVGESIVHPPSHCSGCGTKLKARDLIPLLSYVASKGRCRYCGMRLSWLYPASEAMTGLLFLWIFNLKEITTESLIGFTLVSMGIIVSVADMIYMRIPNKILMFFAPLFIILVIIWPAHSLWSHGLGAIAGGGILVLIVLITGAMGIGDVKLFALCGWCIGLPNTLLALLLACAIGTLVGGGLMLTGQVKRGQPISFGPFLMIGTLIAYGYGSEIIGGYLSLIG
ncbi:leader peptidase (prepilin peptidase)/N-methyltransferase [Paenibacillus shirakamiensis]|uniref:Leader peptidase (Prepilin peptidase)/N-methyltransferase n=1 Tax=Paenibacillus shirakamiensis TaxID=1265935 RepID=A0ABS4JIP3_9BACL|nr:A24 family peptidase [Paenibacillus shirakamiensis]MBP2001578.1 leader peptidase (prepilin peptidase)/N-methyltransferase [Paenibacillus shirakamiensis]